MSSRRVEGGELFDRVIEEDYILTEKACAIFMRQVCAGVNFMHQKNVLHLDMKVSMATGPRDGAPALVTYRGSPLHGIDIYRNGARGGVLLLLPHVHMFQYTSRFVLRSRLN